MASNQTNRTTALTALSLMMASVAGLVVACSHDGGTDDGQSAALAQQVGGDPDDPLDCGCADGERCVEDCVDEEPPDGDTGQLQTTCTTRCVPEDFCDDFTECPEEMLCQNCVLTAEGQLECGNEGTCIADPQHECVVDADCHTPGYIPDYGRCFAGTCVMDMGACDADHPCPQGAGMDCLYDRVEAVECDPDELGVTGCEAPPQAPEIGVCVPTGRCFMDQQCAEGEVCENCLPNADNVIECHGNIGICVPAFPLGQEEDRQWCASDQDCAGAPCLQYAACSDDAYCWYTINASSEPELSCPEQGPEACPTAGVCIP